MCTPKQGQNRFGHWIYLLVLCAAVVSVSSANYSAVPALKQSDTTTENKALDDSVSAAIDLTELRAEQFTAVTLKRDTVHLLSLHDSCVLLVFANRYQCHTCFAKIGHFVRDSLGLDSSRVMIAALARFGSKALDRRAARARLQEILPQADTVLFDIQPHKRDGFPPREVQGGLHGALDISYTPQVLLLNRRDSSTRHLFRYRELYITGAENADSLGLLSWEGKHRLTEALRRQGR